VSGASGFRLGWAVCVRVREGWELVSCVLAVLREQAALLRIGHAHGPCVRSSTTTTRPLMLSMAEAEVIVPLLAFVYFQRS
jgi:hypothetical protein